MSGICNHPDEPHTVMYWLEDGGPPIPMTASFDNWDDAFKFATSGIEQNNPILRWIKMFRSDNEMYTCYQWDNPMEAKDLSVKVDVDSASFKKVFDTIADGFDKHHRAIIQLWIYNVFISVALLLHLLDHIL